MSNDFPKNTQNKLQSIREIETMKGEYVTFLASMYVYIILYTLE